MKKAALLLVEVVAFTLLAQAAGGWLFGLPVDGPAQLGIWFLFALAILILGWIFNKLLRSEGIRELGFRCPKGITTSLWLGVLAFAVDNLLSLPFDLAAMPDRVDMTRGILGQLHLSSPMQILVGGGILALALGFFTGAFHEEIRFRGYYQGVGARELTPLAGVLIGLIPFSLGHYFAQSHWTPVQVLATIVPAILYGLIYYATGSLLVVMTAHTLVNWLPAYSSLLSIVTGSRAVGMLTIVALALLCLLLIVLRWNRELRDWREATLQLFADRSLFGVIAGLLIGSALLVMWPYRPPVQTAALAGAALLGIAILGKRRWNATKTKPR
jgi:membrane protease YdiL (CAAX protease family)